MAEKKTQLSKNPKESLTNVSVRNSFLIGYSKIHELNLVTIGLASSEKIQQWAEKVLPNGKILGEVTNANTLHYKTFKPTKGGLFCERIFGPLKDFECACGVRQKPRLEDSEKILDHLETKRKFCEICDVEYTWSVIRRYQLGYIQLTSPVTHMWYLKANPSYLSILLDVKKKKLESIIYCTETTTLENVWKALHNYGLDNSPSFVYLSWKQLLNQDKQIAITNEKNTNNFKKNFFLKKQLQKKIVPKQLNDWDLMFESRSKNSSNQKTENLNFKIEKDLYNGLKMKIQNKKELKFRKFLIPVLWKKFWYGFVQKTYLFSLNQAKYLWSNLWFLFLQNEKIFSSIQSKTNLKFRSKMFLSHHVNKRFKTLMPKNPIFNRFLVKENFYFPFTKIENHIVNLPKNTLILGQPINMYYEERKSYLKINRHSLKNETVTLVSKKYMLLYLLNLLKIDKASLKLTEKINRIPNEQFKLKFLKKFKFEFCKNLKILQQTISFNLTKNHFFEQSEVVILFKPSSFNFLISKNSLSTFISQFRLKNNFQLATFKHYKNILELSQINIFNSANLNFINYPNIKKTFFEKTLKSFLNSPQIKNETQSILTVNKLASQKSQFYRNKEICKFGKIICKASIFEKNLNFKNSFFKDPLFSSESTSLINNMYCISYFYSWDLERDWKYFLYYTSGTSNFVDFQIPFYKNRTINFSELNIHNSITGAALIQRLLGEFQTSELKKISKQHQILLPKIRKKIRQLKGFQGKIPKSNLSEIEKLLKKRDHIMRRLKIIRQLVRKNTNPTSMILSKLPVLPPDLRPILKLEDQIAASDLNTLYQRIIFRNDRLKKFLKDPAISQSFESKYAQRLLQEAVDNLIQNGKGNVKPETNSRGQALKSLSEILKGKQGRFRQYLLGKRVDYSGRSVIVVGPKLKLNECGLPKEMALELFLPFLIKRILHYKLAATIIGAKNLIKSNEPIILDLLSEVMQNHPVLLNRAPTLHRLGIQAFQPKLVEGRAILIHPLVCPAFNADFDGDQMAVHVPMTVEARVESWKLMFSGNNLISPATGEPIILPSQDMVLGCYYLTTEKFRFHKAQIRKVRKFKQQTNKFFVLNADNFISNDFLPTDLIFQNLNQVIKAYQLDLINAHSSIWVKWNGLVETKSTLLEPFELQINLTGSVEEIQSHIYRRFNSKFVCIRQFIKTTPGRVLFNELIQRYIRSKTK